MDANGILLGCIAAGTPGVFAPHQTGGSNITHFVKVMNKQYNLANSDGFTWVDMDSTNLVQTITPLFNAQAVISVSTDLWTANSGFNQDIGIFISGGAYAGQPDVGATIFAGAGPLPPNSAGGGVAGQVSPTRLATHLVVDAPFAPVLRVPANDPSKTPPPLPPLDPRRP